MNAFGNKALNALYAKSLTEDIVAILIRCCSKMKLDAAKGRLLPRNSENRITNRLFHDYLEKEHVHQLFHFQLQSPENYNPETDLYRGVGDIRVVPWNMLTVPKACFLIECKRIDGSPPLNREYIKEGVQRFIEESPKYKSYFGRSIMLGYVVSSIDIPENVLEIDKRLAELVDGVSVGNLVLVRHNSDWYVYSSESTSGGGVSIILDHLFFDFSGAIQI